MCDQCKTQGCGCKGESREQRSISTSASIFTGSATAMALGHALAKLHDDDREGQAAFRHSLALLSSQNDSVETAARLFRAIHPDDHALRWSLLYILAQAPAKEAATFFWDVAVQPVPSADRYDQRACETPRDGELLVRTMAIVALARSATERERKVELLFSALKKQQEPVLQVELAKALLDIS